MSAFRVEVRVMPRAALLDPQGQAVEHALHALGFGEVARVRMGKHLVLEVKAASRDEALERARAMCERLLANPVTEDYDLAVDREVVVFGDRVREEALAHRPRPLQRLVARRRLHLEHQVFAHPHAGDLAEPEGVQGVLDRLALRVEQRGPRHDAHFHPERAHPWLPPSRSRAPMARGGGPSISPPGAPSAITIGPAMSVSSSSSSKKKPSSVARRIPYTM